MGVFLIVIAGRLNFWTYESFNLDLAFLVLGLLMNQAQLAEVLEQ